MSNKYFSGRNGHYIYCDICGQAVYARDAKKLDTKTGRGGLLVCPQDADKIDPGLIAYEIPVEKSVKWARVNHTNITNGTPPADVETFI